jgi:hypothetical protein
MNTSSPLPLEIWERTPPEAREKRLALEAEVEVLRGQVVQLTEIVQELQKRLGRTSCNSSQPPSADPPHAVGKRLRRETSGRRPGGQTGPEGQTRVLVPEVDGVFPVKPVQGRGCGRPWWGEDLWPQRHQVLEVPPIEPVVMEYQRHRLVGLTCGVVPRADLPVGVPRADVVRVCRRSWRWARGRITC